MGLSLGKGGLKDLVLASWYQKDKTQGDEEEHPSVFSNALFQKKKRGIEKPHP